MEFELYLSNRKINKSILLKTFVSKISVNGEKSNETAQISLESSRELNGEI